MKTVAMESFCVLEVILCWVVGSTDSINRLLGLHPGGEDLSPTVQASSSYFSFSGYFICYISMLLPAGVRGEPKAAF
jgi:hypothetical protein